MQVDLELDDADSQVRLPKLARVMQTIPEQTVNEGTEILASQMYVEVPIVSGRLQSSIFTMINGLVGTVSTNSGYGKAVDEGRRGFTVRPRKAQSLRFFINGKIVFAKESHPGPSRPNRFTKRTIQNSVPRITSMIQTVFNENMAKA